VQAYAPDASVKLVYAFALCVLRRLSHLCVLTLQGGRPASAAEPTAPTALQRALERCAGQGAPQRSKPAAGEHPVAADRFERLLAEAEACVRARSVSPCMQKGMPGAGASPTCNMPALRPITPLQLGVNAVDAAGKSGLPRSLLGVELGQHNGQHGMSNFMLPAAAVSGRPASATASDGYGRGRHASLAQALAAAAAAAEVDSADEDGAGMGLQGSPNSQSDVSASNAGSVANRGDVARAFDAAVDAYLTDGAAGRNLPQEGGAKHPHFEGQHGPASGDLRSHMQVRCPGHPCMHITWPCRLLCAEACVSMHVCCNGPTWPQRNEGLHSASCNSAGKKLHVMWLETAHN
jgi:hypothetical protein